MSIDFCQRCGKKLDTDFVEYQPDGSLLCDGCLDELENEQEPDWKALAGELAEALESIVSCWESPEGTVQEAGYFMFKTAKAALAKYDCSMKEQQEKGV
jgi:hypothetical protein